MKSTLLTMAALGVATLMFSANANAAGQALAFKVKTIDGKEADLSQYQGKVVLIVNTASYCGLTPQYKGLQALYDKHKDDGLVILGFPANEFGKQEPGTDDDIKKFCSSKYNVTFPMFSKVVVKGEDKCDLYKYLTAQDAQPKGPGEVSWNFEKFLIDKTGNVVARFEPRTKPDDPKLIAAIDKELKK